MSDPVAPPPDDKDWTWVLDRPCPDCGFSGAAADEVPARIRATIPVWQRVLAEPDVRVRPLPEVWSPLEYGCHVRDVCGVFGRRLALMLATDGAHFADWDQDEAAVAGRYHEADPSVVAGAWTVAADALASDFDAVDGDQWQRRGLRSNGSAFTVATLGGYLVHDLEHHLWDVQRA